MVKTVASGGDVHYDAFTDSLHFMTISASCALVEEVRLRDTGSKVSSSKVRLLRLTCRGLSWALVERIRRVFLGRQFV